MQNPMEGWSVSEQKNKDEEQEDWNAEQEKVGELVYLQLEYVKKGSLYFFISWTYQRVSGWKGIGKGPAIDIEVSQEHNFNFSNPWFIS